MWLPIRLIVNSISALTGTQRKGRSLGAAIKTLSDPARMTLVVVLTDRGDRDLLEEVSNRNRWNVHFAQEATEARELVSRLKPPIIFFDRDAPGNDWRSAVSMLASVGGACVLLVSTVADDYLWNEVVLNGGYDVLPKPLRATDVSRAVRLAWSYWNGIRAIAALKR